MSCERIYAEGPDVIDHKFTCDARGCTCSALNGLKHPDLPKGWGKVKVQTALQVAPFTGQAYKQSGRSDSYTLFVEAGGDLCPADLAKLSQTFFRDDAWHAVGRPEVPVENPFPLATPEVRFPPFPPPPEGRTCSHCDGPGPFDSNEEVSDRTRGAYTWTSICQWCAPSTKPGYAVYKKDRPSDMITLLMGPTPESKFTKI